MGVFLANEPADDGEGFLHAHIPIQVIDGKIAQDVEDDTVAGSRTIKAATRC